jgi:hypothetical protein
MYFYLFLVALPPTRIIIPKLMMQNKKKIVGFYFQLKQKEALVFFCVEELLATSFIETFVKRLLLFFVPCTFRRC